MVGSVFKELSLSYLTDQIGVEYFSLTNKTLQFIVEDGHFDEKKSDKELAGALLEQILPPDFFYSNKNLRNFLGALPDYLTNKIFKDLATDITRIKWEDATSNYFINLLGISNKFEYRDSPSKDANNQSLMAFDKPQFIFKKLKDYQSKVFYNVYDYVSKVNFARCIVQMPTGSGKTRTAMEIICETINNTEQSVLWLANTEELCDQAFDSFIEVWRFLGKKEVQAINHIRNKNEYDLTLQSFHVSSLQGFNIKDKDKKIEKLLGNNGGLALIVVDEAHISIAPTYKNTITNLLKEGAKLIGLTATPGRSLKSNTESTIYPSSEKSDNELLSDFYFNKKFEIDTGEKAPIDFLRNKGILSNAKFTSLEGSTVENFLSKKDLEKIKTTKKIPEKLKDLLTNDYRRNSIIFDKLVSLLKENKKIIFFGTSISHSKLIASLINLKGFKAAHVDGNSGRHRKSIIESFKKGNVQLLCNYGVLSTGFDDPQIDVVFMARPTHSIVLYSQIIGRGLRGPEIGGTDTCEVITVFDNILDLPENNHIYSYFDDYFLNLN